MVDEAARFQRRYRGELPDLYALFLKEVFDLSHRNERRKRVAVIGGVAFLTMLLAADVLDRADDSAHVDFTRFIDEVASVYTRAIVDDWLQHRVRA